MGLEQALPVPVEVLDVAAPPPEEREAPFELQGALVVVQPEIVPDQDAEPVSLPQVVNVDLSVAQVLLEPGIVVVLLVFRDAVPGIEEENDVVPLESDVLRQAVPASGLRFP